MLRLANYTLKEQLGKGSFGAVFRASNESGDEFAVKRFRATRTDERGATHRTNPGDAHDEIASASRLATVHHPNLVRVHHLVPDPGSTDEFLPGNAIVFEFCHEGTLERFIRQRNTSRAPLSRFETVSLAWQLLSGLCVLHEQKLMHHDLAPRNVFLARNDANHIVFKIGDFGRCRYLSAKESKASMGNYSMHAAPEAETNFRSDVFSVGVMLFEAMTLKVLDDTVDRDDLKVERERLRSRLSTLESEYGKAFIDIMRQIVSESAVDRLDAPNALRAIEKLDISELSRTPSDTKAVIASIDELRTKPVSADAVVDAEAAGLGQTFGAFVNEKLLGDQQTDTFCGRDWLFADVRDNLKRLTGSALIIRGSAGLGKSSVIARVIQSLSQEQRLKLGITRALPAISGVSQAGFSVLACHFCKHNDANTQDVELMIRSLGAALAQTVPGFRLAGAPSRADAAATFNARLLAPLRDCKPPPLPEGAVHCLLVDALDESLVTEGVSVAAVLANAVSNSLLPPWLKLIATTRPEPRVLSLFSGFGSSFYDFDAGQGSEQRAKLERDTEAYLRSRVSKSEALTKAVLEFDVAKLERVAEFKHGGSLLEDLEVTAKGEPTSPLSDFFSFDVLATSSPTPAVSPSRTTPVLAQEAKAVATDTASQLEQKIVQLLPPFFKLTDCRMQIAKIALDSIAGPPHFSLQHVFENGVSLDRHYFDRLSSTFPREDPLWKTNTPRRVLEIVAASRVPLCSPQLQFVATSILPTATDTDYHQSLARLGSFFAFQADAKEQSVSFHHKTVNDWIKNRDDYCARVFPDYQFEPGLLEAHKGQQGKTKQR